MVFLFQVVRVLCWVGTEVLYIIKKVTISARLSFVYSVLKLQIIVHDKESSVHICCLFTYNKTKQRKSLREKLVPLLQC